jgi:hypothetical protein
LGLRPFRFGREFHALRGDKHGESFQESLEFSMTEPLPNVDFATLVLSLSHSALVHLGQADDPNDLESRIDLTLARHSVDLIALLEEKTKGNLTGQEERLIGSVLVDLRARMQELAADSAAKVST